MVKQVVWLLIIASCAAFWIAVGHAAYAWLKTEHAAELAECRGEATAANEHVQQLLSGGRFIRQYDPKLGKSIYTFRGPR
jgi:hypothetical protein